jgi:hypothetical protein
MEMELFKMLPVTNLYVCKYREMDVAEFKMRLNTGCLRLKGALTVRLWS